MIQSGNSKLFSLYWYESYYQESIMTSVKRSKQSESSEIDGALHSIESKSLGIVFT
jgi:hypothetical protein